MTGQYLNCIIHQSADALQEVGSQEVATRFKKEAKKFFGINNLDGLPPGEQIKKMNQFWRHKLEPVPNTTFIRSWLEDHDNMHEYMMFFERNWSREIVKLGVF
jgi:hypothetical protein